MHMYIKRSFIANSKKIVCMYCNFSLTIVSKMARFYFFVLIF